jgi:hypothetical protein
MPLRDELVRRISRKNQEIASLDQQVAGLTQQISVAKAYVQAIEDTVKMLDRDALAGPVEKSLRRGSAPARAQKALRNVGRPMHITKLLPEMGLPVNRKTRSTVSSALSAYWRRGEIFTRPAPNTFGLVEFGENAATEQSAAEQSEGDDTPLIRMAR